MNSRNVNPVCVCVCDYVETDDVFCNAAKRKKKQKHVGFRLLKNRQARLKNVPKIFASQVFSGQSQTICPTWNSSI